MGEAALRGSWHAFPAERRDFRRVLAGSALAHAAVLAFFVFAPNPQGEMMLPGVVEVDLIAAAAAPAAAKARPAAPPKPPTPKTVVLPKEAADPKPKPEAKPVPKPEQKSLEEVMKELEREDDLDELEPAPRQQVAQATPGAIAGRGVRIDAATAGWMRRARIHVRQNWVLAPGFRAEDLETHVRVELDASGRVVGEPEITKRSGNPWYDDSVVRALVKASPLPPPPAAGEWPFVFRPEEIL